ncbi:MAG: A/G-specific adenine glycosylase [Burkholderiales bacterium]|nr:A/G-specific adenine glycosylase [Nitrosomonas sp.]MCP5275359.1 A/G-specific adenine glycosylase [Burkholderiales bacterium]
MSQIAELLIPWQKKYGRHHLPWQVNDDPYTVWLSEIMLQQTQVKTVIPYYRRFIKRFPDINSLAQAPIDEVLACWSGLGYYARARHLHQTACKIMQNHQGVFPQLREEIQQLPGIGRSTAAAIAVFAYGKREAILDGNVKRVFTRYFGIERYPGEPDTLKRLWNLAEKSLPGNGAPGRIKAYTQALMDLGSAVCVRRKPFCSRCPLQKSCAAFNENRIALIPAPSPKKQLPVKETVFMIYRGNRQLLLEKRPDKGIWGGLWCFPENRLEDKSAFRVNKARPVELPRLLHVFTHFKLSITPFLLDVDRTETMPDSIIWAQPDVALELAIPAPVKKLIKRHFLF